MTDNQLILTEPAPTGELFLTGIKAVEAVVVKIEEHARQQPVSIADERGRKACASLAFQISRTKTFLDGMGKDLAGEIAKSRKLITTRLDGLRDEVRQPLTEWEAKEKARAAEIQGRFDLVNQQIEKARIGTIEEARGILERLESTKKMAKNFHFGDRLDEAKTLIGSVTLQVKGIIAEKQEAEAERERRRAEHEANLRRMAEEKRLNDEAANAKRLQEAEAEKRLAEEQEARRKADEDKAEAGHGTTKLVESKSTHEKTREDQGGASAQPNPEPGPLAAPGGSEEPAKPVFGEGGGAAIYIERINSVVDLAKEVRDRNNYGPDFIRKIIWRLQEEAQE